MVARVNTVAFQGIDVIDVDVQVQINAGRPAFSVVGLAEKAVAESRERVRGALSALGLALPPKRITVNLAPADLAKEGSHYDLPIALGLLTAMEVLPAEEMMNFIAMGEAAWVKGLEVLAPNALLNLINHFKGAQMLAQPAPLAEEAAGGHNLLMCGVITPSRPQALKTGAFGCYPEKEAGIPHRLDGELAPC